MSAVVAPFMTRLIDQAAGAPLLAAAGLLTVLAARAGTRRRCPLDTLDR